MRSQSRLVATLLALLTSTLVGVAGCSKGDGGNHSSLAMDHARSQTNAIIDGRPVQKNEEIWKSVVQLTLLNAQGIAFDFCTGTLIANNVVLTAAHCLTNPRTGRIRINFSQGTDTDPSRSDEEMDTAFSAPIRWAKTSVTHPEFTGGQTIWKTYSAHADKTHSYAALEIAPHNAENAEAGTDVPSDFPAPEQEVVDTARTQLLKTRGSGPDFAFDLFTYDAQGSHDLGLVFLDQDVPSPYKPLAILQEPTHVWSPNEVLHAGYGLSHRILDTADLGILRVSEATILGWTSNHLIMETYTDTADHAACSGDSGGPALIKAGSDYEIAGVISISDCWSMTSDVLVLRHRAWIHKSINSFKF